MANWSKTSVAADAGRTELHDALALTGAEVSINRLPAGVAVPFVHSHKENEEVYGVIEGKAEMFVDGEVVELAAGDWMRVGCEAKRALKAADTEGCTVICIQVKAGSLCAFTMGDGVITEDKAPWHK